MTRLFTIGARVFWSDPDEGLCSGPGTITMIGIVTTPGTVVMADPSDIVTVLKDDGGEVEAFPYELAVLP